MKSAIDELEGKARAAKAASRRMAYISAEALVEAGVEAEGDYVIDGKWFSVSR